MAEEEVRDAASEQEETSDFKAPAPKTLNEILDADKEDEALNKYKQALLGSGDNSKAAGEAGFKLVKMTVLPVESDAQPLTYTPPENYQFEKTKTTAKKVKAVKCTSSNIRLPEGTKYVVELHFQVTSGMIYGLHYSHNVVRGGVTLDREKVVLGSYAASDDVKLFKTREDQAPSGLVGRGTYHVKSKFFDDDANLYFSFEWDLEICKK